MTEPKPKDLAIITHERELREDLEACIRHTVGAWLHDGLLHPSAYLTAATNSGTQILLSFSDGSEGRGIYEQDLAIWLFTYHRP